MTGRAALLAEIDRALSALKAPEHGAIDVHLTLRRGRIVQVEAQVTCSRQVEIVVGQLDETPPAAVVLGR